MESEEKRCPTCKGMFPRGEMSGGYCKPCRASYMASYMPKYKEKNPLAGRLYQFVKRLGRPKEEFDAMVERFEGHCEICNDPIEGKAQCLDHDHVTGKLRGWLCTSCNGALGLFKDDWMLLEKASKYLQTRS